MKVELVKPYGFCFGVKKALEIVKKAKIENPNENVYVLGGLVHNENIQKELTDMGLILLNDKEKSIRAWLEELPCHSIVVFSAHGHAPQVEQIAKNKKMKIYDATCPFVKENEKAILDEVRNNRDVIYIGEDKHAESLAAIEIDENKVHLIQCGKEFDHSKVASEMPFVISQTTMMPDEISSCISRILEQFPKARIAQGRCYATKERQDAVLKVSEDADCFVILGSKTSNNTNKLEEIARNSHPKAAIIRALTIGDIEKHKDELMNFNHIYIVSGASTSDKLVDDAFIYIKSIKQ